MRTALWTAVEACHTNTRQHTTYRVSRHLVPLIDSCTARVDMDRACSPIHWHLPVPVTIRYAAHVPVGVHLRRRTRTIETKGIWWLRRICLSISVYYVGHVGLLGTRGLKAAGTGYATVYKTMRGPWLDTRPSIVLRARLPSHLRAVRKKHGCSAPRRCPMQFPVHPYDCACMYKRGLRTRCPSM
jgi:hypothetical protein